MDTLCLDVWEAARALPGDGSLTRSTSFRSQANIACREPTFHFIHF